MTVRPQSDAGRAVDGGLVMPSLPKSVSAIRAYAARERRYGR